MPDNSSDLVIYIPVHVDDSLSAMNSPTLYDWIVTMLNKHFKVNNLGPADIFLRIKIERDHSRKRLWLSQQDYIKELLQSHSMSDANPTTIPLRAKLHTLSDPPNLLPKIPDDKLTHYHQHITGQLLYPAVCTCPDIAFTAAALGQYNANPTRTTSAAAKDVLQYLAGTHDYCLEYGGDATKTTLTDFNVDPSNVAFSDSDWGSDKSNHRSFLGYSIFVFDGLVSWSSSKQKATSLSSTELEYMALTHLIKELLWIKLFLKSLSLPCAVPFLMLSDNESSLTIANSQSNSPKLKHINIRYHFIREHLHTGTFSTTWIPTCSMTANILTKPLSTIFHHAHVTGLGLVSR